MDLNQYNLRPLWNALLNIYSVFAEICDRNDLRFYVTDGTALGAVRHKGFIPWDDDFDISMPRPDYEKFLAIAAKELPSYYRVVNWKNTPEFDCMFTKIQDCRRDNIEAVEKKLGWRLSNGLFLDIFPIDGYPDSKLGAYYYRFRMKILWFMRRYYATKFSSHTLKGKFAWIIGLGFASILWNIKSLSSCLEAADNLNKSCAFGETILTGRSATTMWKRFILPCTVYGTPKYFEFDGKLKVPVPNDYDAFLKYDYNDYMTLPPKDKRHPTHSYSDYCPWWLGPTNEKDCV